MTQVQHTTELYHSEQLHEKVSASRHVPRSLRRSETDRGGGERRRRRRGVRQRQEGGRGCRSRPDLTTCGKASENPPSRSRWHFWGERATFWSSQTHRDGTLCAVHWASFDSVCSCALSFAPHSYCVPWNKGIATLSALDCNAASSSYVHVSDWATIAFRTEIWLVSTVVAWFDTCWTLVALLWAVQGRPAQFKMWRPVLIGPCTLRNYDGTPKFLVYASLVSCFSRSYKHTNLTRLTWCTPPEASQETRSPRSGPSIVGSRAHRISAASHRTSAAFRRPSHFPKLRTTGLKMSSYVSPDAWILSKAMSSVEPAAAGGCTISFIYFLLHSSLNGSLILVQPFAGYPVTDEACRHFPSLAWSFRHLSWAAFQAGHSETL